MLSLKNLSGARQECGWVRMLHIGLAWVHCHHRRSDRPVASWHHLLLAHVANFSLELIKFGPCTRQCMAIATLSLSCDATNSSQEPRSWIERMTSSHSKHISAPGAGTFQRVITETSCAIEWG